MEGLLPATSGAPLDLLLLAAASGAALALLAAALLRRRGGDGGGERLRHLASRASTLAAGAPPAEPPAPELLAGRDDVAELARALHGIEQRLLEGRAGREAFTTRALEEVKRPLGLLATSIDLALRRRPEVPELTAALRDAQREAERISRLAARIVTLQGLARSVQRAPIDLTPVARQAWQEALPAATQRGLKLELAVPATLPMRGDAAALGLALSELLANALRASRFGGAVVVGAVREGGLVRLSVRDEGPGIPRERRKLAFEPFAHGAHGWSPSATGLALVREVARGHGGTASVEDAEVGAHLLLELPAE